MTTLWLKKKKNFKGVNECFGKFKFKDSFDRNNLSRSNMDLCLGEKKKHQRG